MNLFKKRTPIGYIVLYLNTGYETIPNVKCAIGVNEGFLKKWKYDNNYWYQTVPKRTIPLFKREVAKLKKKGFDLSEYNYWRYLGYDEWLNVSKRKIINAL